VSGIDDVITHVAQGLGREHRHPRQLTRRDARHELAGDHVKWRGVGGAGGETTAPADARAAGWGGAVCQKHSPGTPPAPAGGGRQPADIRRVARLYDQEEGVVRIDGHDVRELTLSSMPDTIATVTQETYLFHDTVRAARAAFIHDRIQQLPEGYETKVGERGHRPSGGEKQRVAI